MFRFLRKLYDWILSWAEKPGGTVVLFVISGLETFIFPIPPDVLLIALALGEPRKAMYFALVCTVGSTVGGSIGYIIGYWFWEITKDFFLTYVFSPEFFNRVAEVYRQNAFWTVYIVGFTPVSDKPFVIGAGVFSVNYIIFIISYTLSRATRFYTVALTIKVFGPKAKEFIDRYFNLLAVAFAVLILIGVAIAKFILKE